MPKVTMDASCKTSISLVTLKEIHIAEAIFPKRAAFEITQHVSQSLILPPAFWWLEGISSYNPFLP